MARLLFIVCSLFVVAAAPAPQPAAIHAVVLVTLDGARTEEVFGGLDVEALGSQLAKGQRVEDHPLYRRYWAPTPEERRLKLLPFLWGTLLANEGSIAGNAKLGSRVGLANRHHFSYPGYAEILTGRAHDDTIASNDPTRNPYPTALEFLKARLGLDAAGVAAFASWSVFDAIAEHTEGALTVNAGFEAWPSPDPDVQRLSQWQFETPTPWATVRHDAYTMRFAMDHMARHRPRVLYLAFGETDDWAHDGRYDRVLDAYTRTDRHIEELWRWLQAQPDYRGRTALLVTTDHGRGRGPVAWRDHGKDVAGAGDTWMAFVSPTMPERGEWRAHQPLVAGQAAATLIEWMGLDWRAFDPAMAPPATRRSRK